MSEHGSGHPDFEALSAYVDGEAPEWADHVAGCAACRGSAEELRAVAAVVAVPVEAVDPDVRDAAVRAALGDVDQRHRAEQARVARRRFAWQLNVAAVAALVLGVLGMSALLFTQTTSDRTTVAGPTLESAPPAGDALAGRQSESSAAAALLPTDLGDVPDAATLVARARPAVAATSSTNSGATVSGAPGAVSGSSGGAGAGGAPSPTAPRAIAPNVVGTRPCEEQARARDASLREVVYFATARRGQVPAVVLGFASGPAPGPVTLLMLAQEGCSELLRAPAGP